MFPIHPPEEPYDFMERVIEGADPKSLVYTTKVGFEIFAMTYPVVRTIEERIPIEYVLVQQYRDKKQTITRIAGCSNLGICTADYIYTEKDIAPFVPEVGVSKFIRDVTSQN